MKIEIARPPHFEDIAATFPGASGPGVIFAYGDTIYNPSNIVIPPALLAHEEVHGKRQHASPEQWWVKYIADPEFRYTEELHAHAAEYKTLMRVIHDRNDRARLAMVTARRLLAPLYNYGKPKSLNQAICDLRWAVERK